MERKEPRREQPLQIISTVVEVPRRGFDEESYLYVRGIVDAEGKGEQRTRWAEGS
jgi:hypothetical protein